MTAAAVEARHIFGLTANVANNVCYVDEHTVVYPAGTTLVIHNTQTHAQRFIPGLEGNKGYSALAVSANKRYVAAAETREGRPQVVVFDLQTLKRRKTLVNVEAKNCTEYLYLSFSPDSKYLVLLGNGDWELLYWCWEKSRGLMASTRVSPDVAVHSLTVNPADDTHMCAAGKGLLKTFRYTEGNIKTLANVKMKNPADFLCHAWVSPTHVAAGTDQGTVLVYEGQELKAEVAIAGRPGDNDGGDGNNSGVARSVVSIVALPEGKGFVCADDHGDVHVCEAAEDDAMSFAVTRSETVPALAGIADVVETLALAPSAHVVVATTRAQQLYMMRLVPLEGDAALEVEDGSQDGVFLLTQSHHHGAVHCADIALRKPLVVTCSADKSIRIWDHDKKVLTTEKYFPEEALSVAMHPSGLQVLVGFSDKLRLLSVVNNDLKIVKEFLVRNCNECVFSHGGHKFAAASGSSIELYHTFTFAPCGVLRGHNNKVQSIVWSRDDMQMTTCGADGAVYVWDARTLARTGENVIKSCSYSCATASPDMDKIFVVGSDQTLKEIVDSTVENDVPSINKQAPTPTTLTQVAMSDSGRMLLAATEVGSVRAVKYPLTTPWEGTSAYIHAGAVSKMRMSHDDRLLVSVGVDGCVVLYTLSDREGRGRKQRPPTYSHDVLIADKDLRDKDKLIKEQAMQIRELKIFNNYQLELKEMGHKDVLKQLNATSEDTIDDLRAQVEALTRQNEAFVASHQNEVATMSEKHTKALEDLEYQHNQKLLVEYEKYKDLEFRAQDMQEKCERQLADMESAKAKALEDLAEFWENKLMEKGSLLDAANEKGRDQQKEYVETRRQIEVDADQEILSLKISYERRLKEEQEKSLRLHGDNGILRKKFKSQAKDIADAQTKKDEMDAELKKLHTHIRALEKDIVSGKKEIAERDETIQDKEKRIYDLKKKNQELEKFKFVLDYKIKELKKQIEPREKEIKEMRVQISQMDEELAKYYEQNAALELDIQNMQDKLRAAALDSKANLKQIATLEQRSKRFRADLHNTAQFVTEPKHLTMKVRKLYKTYCEDMMDYDSTVDEDVQREANRQREFLEKKAESITAKLRMSRKMHDDDVTRIMKENQVLIREINQLRQELKLSKTESHTLEATLRTTVKLSEMRGTKLPDLTETIGATKTLRETMDGEGLEKIIHMQKNEIRKLRSSLSEMEATQRDRPVSTGTRLEPLAT